MRCHVLDRFLCTGCQAVFPLAVGWEWLNCRPTKPVCVVCVCVFGDQRQQLELNACHTTKAATKMSSPSLCGGDLPHTHWPVELGGWPIQSCCHNGVSFCLLKWVLPREAACQAKVPAASWKGGSFKFQPRTHPPLAFYVFPPCAYKSRGAAESYFQLYPYELRLSGLSGFQQLWGNSAVGCPTGGSREQDKVVPPSLRAGCG